jgi:hypothetical protein
VFAALVMAALPATLWTLGVRDWRIYGVVLLWQPVLVAWETANVSLLLVFGLAVMWRHRDHPVVPGIVLAVLASVKVFLFPIGLWLLATRRLRQLAAAVAGTIVINLASWSIIGFSEIKVYVHQLQAFGHVAERWGYSFIGLLLHLGAGQAAASAVGAAVAGAALVAGLRAAPDRRSFALFTASVAACLLASPVVESHYLTLALVPLAIAQPSMAPVWLAPMLLLLTPADHPNTWQHVLSLAVSAIVLLRAATTDHGGPSRRAHPAARS